ncbi:MAG: BrnT family toxin [Terracidiphilus sp.]
MQKYNYTIVVSGVRFDWDEAKNLSNQRKHGVSFEEASQVFLDPLFVSLKERIEDDEQRWQTYGEVRSCLLVMVAHTVREVDKHGEMVEVMRIISARYASRKERQRYEDENR